MAEEHENRPSLKTGKEFRQVVEVGPASTWDKFYIKLFNVDYSKDPDELPHEVDECAAKEKDSEMEKRTT